MPMHGSSHMNGTKNGQTTDNDGGMADGGETYPLPSVVSVDATPGEFDSEVAPDTNPKDDVVEVDLEARVADVEIAPGHVLSMWTYNGQLPGPRIEAHVGDTVRVHFKNSLPEETTIHWHGVRVPNDMDGVPMMDDAIQPGSEFTYEFKVPDSGTFWYHPHVRSAEQVERGLYGAFVVRGDDEPEVTSEHTVVLDDVYVDDDWMPMDFDSMDDMMGRQGNVLLANGHAHPQMTLDAGGLHRFRFINSATARYFRLALPEHSLVQIGADGGLFTRPATQKELLLVPGQRADVLVQLTADEKGTLEWQDLDYDRGHHSGALGTSAIFDSKIGSPSDAKAPKLPSSLRSIAALGDASVSRRFELNEKMVMMPGTGTAAGGHMHGGHMSSGLTATDTSGSDTTMQMMMMEFSINGEVYPDVTPVKAKLGDIEEWSVVNKTDMDHPFHVHGFRFQVVGSDGNPIPAWRDTVNVPANATIRIRLKLEDHPGMWMFHCHILEHAEGGMMGELMVE
jgi:FtsP/CotA-like multicopper oxidase with cupredoxin domain